MEAYISRKETQENEIKKIKRILNVLSLLRFLCVVIVFFSAYKLYEKFTTTYFLFCFLATISFLFLLRWYDKKKESKLHKEALVAINEDEIAFLKKEKIPFDDGVTFSKPHHEYAYDLDIFGSNSLFQTLNRTYTYIGKKALAHLLISEISEVELLENQEAIQELKSKMDWRQNFMANAKVSNDAEQFYNQLLAWTKNNSQPLPKFAIILLFILPLLFLVCTLGYYFLGTNNWLAYATISFFANLGFASNFIQRIKIENAHSTAIDKIVKQYSLMIATIEKEKFTSKKLVKLQKELQNQEGKASGLMYQLSRLFSGLDSVANPLVVLFFNGCFLYHIHILRKIIVWKQQHREHVEKWLEIIGAFETLQSLANFSYNNPDFCFPTINGNHEILLTNMSHPLLSATHRVSNTVAFQPQSFIILTGSNMSGKSTFLRSLGINMVLARIGSVVCASQANIHPMPILVSMRLSDSLSDSESYFYAEIKRLKQIMDALDAKRSFVLLDEILRGTNSDDKRSGTVEVIYKMIQKKAIGAIATHDIEVCLTADDFPNQLINKCFEVSIENNDLHFDYKLRDGICKNKSATFLMKKIGVI
ncbi:DNA mismatch repair protein [Flavobacterium sp. J27]|uniref:MutS-related protein n=1 Tax=Flavobacterium sp. J27 TaxID=2060419 RepID=UPI00103230B5|nr:DNA mismatch repair protein [Flavobacterium sp. J27]